MEIIQPVLEKDVVDYDFILTNGIKFPTTLDESLGDTCVEEEDRYRVYLAEKPRPTDPDTLMPAETALVFKANLVALVIRKRKQRLPSPEESLEFKNTILKMTGTIQ